MSATSQTLGVDLPPFSTEKKQQRRRGAVQKKNNQQIIGEHNKHK